MSTPENPAIIKENFAEAYDLGQRYQQVLGDVHKIGNGKPFVIIETGKMQVFDVESFAPEPSRLRQSPAFSDADSFIRYVNDFKDDGTRIFALFGDKGGSFTAIVDYHHDTENPRWGQHVAKYTCPTTPEWDAWMALNGKMMKQEEFSEFVEAQRLAFKDPDVATMLEIARTLEASQTGKFESKINPANGNRTLVFKDENTATAGDSKMSIPSTITVLLQPFRRGSIYQVESRLMYRIRDGKVTFQYDLVRAHEVVEEKTAIVPYNGSL